MAVHHGTPRWKKGQLLRPGPKGVGGTNQLERCWPSFVRRSWGDGAMANQRIDVRKTARRSRHSRLLRPCNAGSDQATPQQVSQRSHGFISQATATRELGVLTTRNITTQDASKRPATFRRIANDEWFTLQERKLNLARLAAKDDEKIAEERAHHDDAIGAPRREYRNWLRSQNCVYCVRPASEHEPIQIEHVPPKKLGGGPLTGFEIPAHKRCHGLHSGKIRRFSEQRPPSPVQVTEVDDDIWDLNDDEVLDTIAAWVGRRIMHYAAALNGGDIAEGERTARSIAGVAAVAASPQGAFVLRHTGTGRERRLEIDRWFFQREVVATSRAWTGAALAFAEPATPAQSNAPQV